MAATHSQLDVDNLVAALKAAPQPKAVDVQATFCSVWPTARQALDVLKTILASVPGVGLFAGPAIGIVLAAGEAAQKAFCK